MVTNESRLTRCETEITNLKNNNTKIWEQVSNHLPTQIKSLDEKNDADHQRIYDKLDKIIWYIAIGLIATTGVTIMTQIILK